VPAQADKPKAGLADDDALYMEGFALKIFGNADAADRSGTADVSTAKKLYAACCFLQVLAQFGEPAAELLAKQKYAAWRAAQISGALKKGQVPVPPPGADAQPDTAADAPAADAPAPAAADDFPRPPVGTAHAPLPPPSPAAALPPGGAFAATPPRSPAGRPSLTATPSPPPGACMCALAAAAPFRPCRRPASLTMLRLLRRPEAAGAD
jgi:vacuolar protein sorting-associated protein VTA1